MEILKWEYKSESITRPEKIAELGKKGWEAFGINARSEFIHFKRPCGKIQMREVSQEKEK